MSFQIVLYFVSFWNQTDVLYWKSIPMFVTVLSVAINHEHRDSTLHLFNDTFTGCEQVNIRKAPVTTGLQ